MLVLEERLPAEKLRQGVTGPSVTGQWCKEPWCVTTIKMEGTGAYWNSAVDPALDPAVTATRIRCTSKHTLGV
jgi:hypothetical protein